MRGSASHRTSYGVDLPYRAWTTPDVIFSVIDVDGSEQLSIIELRKFFKKSPLDATKLEAMFASMDTDGSGEISRTEWRAGFHAAGFDSSTVVGQSAEGFGVLLALVKPNFAVHQKMCGLHGNRAPQLTPNAEERGITLHQLRQLWKHVHERCLLEGWMDIHGELIEPNTISMYELMRYVIKPCTLLRGGADSCSYVERCSERVVQPSWTCLHWWGDSFRDLLLCLEQHARDRGVSDECASYWIAAFALSQHSTAPLALRDTTIHAIPRAIALSVGTLLVVDRRGAALRRLWILYEAYLALEARRRGLPHPRMLDVYTPLTHLSRRKLPVPPHEVHAVGLTDGFALVDRGAGPMGEGEASNKVERESPFPTRLVEMALDLRVAEAHTSIEHDKREILTHLEHAHALPTQALEHAVSGRLAVSALRKALELADGGRLYRRALAAIQGAPLSHVSLSLSGAARLETSAASALTHALPVTLACLELRFSAVEPQVADTLLKTLAARVHTGAGGLPRLQQLTLISDAMTADGGYAIGAACATKAPTSLRTLDFGLPAPFEHRVASAIVAVRSPRWLCYFGENRLLADGGGGGVLRGGSSTCIARKGLTSSDLILLLATAARGNPHNLISLELPENDLDEAGVNMLTSMVSDGQLPCLARIDLSDNAHVPDGCKKALLNAMKTVQAGRLGHGFVLSPEKAFLIEPAPEEEEMLE